MRAEHRPEEYGIVKETSPLEAAMMYARAGWPVFPLAGKIPFKGTHGHRDATLDESEIARMWHDHPDANIGLATGEVSGIIVLDMDPRHGGYHSLKALQATYEPLPKTKTVGTPHGGLHVYFFHPRDGNKYPNTAGFLGPGLDTRGDGGYVVLPPSKLYGKAHYSWGSVQEIAQVPIWLLPMLSKEGDKTPFSPQGLGFATVPGEGWLSRALVLAQEGNRNTIGFHLAIQLRDDGVSEAEARDLLISFAHRVPQGRGEPYTISAALASVKSAYARPKRPPAKRQ